MQRGGKAALGGSYDTVNAVLDYAPQPWIRHIARRVSFWGGNKGVSEIGSWVYAVQTGAIAEPRSVGQRFGEEVRDALNWQKRYGQKGLRGPLCLRTMHQRGVHNFCVVCVRKATPRGATKAESEEVEKSPRSLGAARRHSEGYMRWLIRSRLYQGLTRQALNDETRWGKLSKGRPRGLDPMDAVLILAKAKLVLSRPKFFPL